MRKKFKGNYNQQLNAGNKFKYFNSKPYFPFLLMSSSAK